MNLLLSLLFSLIIIFLAEKSIRKHPAIWYCSAFVFGLAATLVGILALLVLFSGNLTNALILGAIAFLVSPVGIPMAAAWLLGKMQDLRYAIQSL